MQLKIKFALIAMCCVQLSFAQINDKPKTVEDEDDQESSFTFTETQLSENDDMSQNVSIIGSSTNIYASNVGYRFSPMRFKYRGMDPRYNDIYINGNPMNDLERGSFSYSLVGGLNNQTRAVESTLPFEDNTYTMGGMAGSNNYNFRPSSFGTGQRVSLAGANRNYTLRGMYTYNSGLMSNGWAYTASLTYRWAGRGYVKGTFYNALSYFFGAEKRINDAHSVSFVTWGNPTERSTQGASTDEGYWLANSYTYNPYWGYQDGKVRNSRVVREYVPTALFTWDWKINDQTKLTTSLSGRYGMYRTTKLNYNNSENPQPDYYKKMPSNFYNVWEENSPNRTKQNLEDWKYTRDYWRASEENRQIKWNQLYASNEQANKAGVDAMYIVQARHNNTFNLSLASNLQHQIDKNHKLTGGISLQKNTGYHYYTIDDLLGAQYYHNVNTYASGNYGIGSTQLMYDIRDGGKLVKEGDKFMADYNIYTNKANAWATFAGNRGMLHYYVSGRIGGTTIQRDGKMQNGLAPENSLGKSGTAKFLDGGGKAGLIATLGHGHTLTLGAGYQTMAPLANTAFAAPEMNNDFVTNLDLEKILSTELSYQYEGAWVHVNLSGYYSKTKNGTEWIPLYYDDANSFSYMSLTSIDREYYGAELGVKFKVTSAFEINVLGTVGESKYTKDADVRYLMSTKGTYDTDLAHIKGMRESGTPLTATSIGLSYHAKGWYLDLYGNYYDRIYLSYSPTYRFESAAAANGLITNTGEFDYDKASQAKGNGGFMLDASIGRSMYVKKGSLSVNLMLTNILNKRDFCTGGYEQSRADYTNSGNARTYVFSMNPKKYYAYGLNGMLIVSYRF